MRTLVACGSAAVVVLGLATVPAVGSATPSAVPHSASTPRWVRHVERYPGGISAGVRAMVSPKARAAQASYRASALAGTMAVGRTARSGPNIQMNDDSDPPLPQNETAVAASLANPRVAVAAANDYVSGGNVVMSTSDGGRHWHSTRVIPEFGGTGDFCTGGDPAVAYSRRDHAFYMGQLCFFRSLPFSEVQIFVSHDNGRTWTPGRTAAVAATNFDYATGTVDTSFFNDKDYITVDNSPTSPHYGRLYVGYTKFHLLPSGFSDYCPLQLAYTDEVNRANPALTTFQHTAIQPDDPGGDGTGMSANQYFTPAVERNGALDVGFVSEDCNDSYDPHLLFQKSTDGGRSFLPQAVVIDKDGQYQDFLNKARDDTLPPTSFRAPNTPSIAYSPRTGTLTYVYQNNVDRPRSKADISVQQSHDGGLHWSNMRFLATGSHGRPARNDQFFPWIAAADNGDLFAQWLDRRLDPSNVRINTWEAWSSNDGRTWHSRRISTASWNPDRGFFSSGAFIGDYTGIAVSKTNVYPTWPDGRHNAIDRTGIGETDIFTDVETRP
jgi:hypothetical protein